MQLEKPLMSEYLLKGIQNLDRPNMRRALRMHNKIGIKKFNSGNKKM